MAGLELRVGRGSYFVEYKFIWASLSGALTGDHSWSLKKLDTGLPRWLIEPFAGLMEMPGDLWRQLSRWWTGMRDCGRRHLRHVAVRASGGGGSRIRVAGRGSSRTALIILQCCWSCERCVRTA